MQVQFIRPEWLLALLALPLTLLLERGSYSALGRFQRRLATAIRLVLLAVLALALAGFQSRNPNPPLQVVYLLDRSLSITPSDFDAARTYVREAVESIPDKRAEKVQSAALIFGRSASFEHGFSKNLDLSEVQSIVADEYTDIARALELAAATFDAGAQKRIVLLSDGRENIGSAEDTARRLRQRGITVDTVPVGTDRADEVLARKVIIPSKADQKETFVVKCVVESAVEKDAILKLYRNNTYIGERNVHLEPGRNVFSFDMTEPSKGFYTYSFEIDAPGDPQSANNRARNFTFVEGQPRMLYLSGDPSERPDLATMLRPKQIDLEFHQTAFMPHDMRDLLTYDAVFFSDVSAETLTPGQQELIRGYVRALGKGFVMIGGDQSFGVGGWYQSTVEEVLPVTMDFKRQQHFPATALCIVIDRSGSMGEMSGGYTKLDLAKKAAEQSGSLLTARDYIGVIQFDSAGSWVTDRLQKASSKSRLRNQIGSISMGGGTNIYAGLRPAVDELQKSRAQVKHIILLTDGMSAPGDWE
ncbi:MAG TPA: VWA domain-containing protein, partial [bacterium]|nr:VWA domain-containing protein [bacterium]